MKLKKILFFTIKLLIAVFGLYFAFKGIDYSLIKNLFTLKLLVAIFVAFSFNLLNIIISSYRLKTITKSNLSLWELSKINLIGCFFNIFLPSTIGGDTARAIKLSKKNEKSNTLDSFLSVFLDRILGIISLLFLGIFSVLICFQSIPQEFRKIIVILSSALLLILITLLFVLLYSNLKFLRSYKLTKNININLTSLKQTVQKVKPILKSSYGKIFLLAVVMHIISSFENFILLWGIGISISPFYIFIVYSILSIVLMIPISIGGLGIRDVLMKLLYQSKTTSSNVVVSGTLSFIVMALTGSIGGIIFLLENRSTKRL